MPAHEGLCLVHLLTLKRPKPVKWPTSYQRDQKINSMEGVAKAHLRDNGRVILIQAGMKNPLYHKVLVIQKQTAEMSALKRKYLPRAYITRNNFTLHLQIQTLKCGFNYILFSFLFFFRDVKMCGLGCHHLFLLNALTIFNF